MDPKSITKHGYLTRIANQNTRNFRARAIPYGSYTETAAANSMVLVGLGLLAVALFSILIKFKVI